MVVPVVVVEVAAGLDSRTIAVTARPADALPCRDDNRWIVVDPPPATIEALQALAGCVPVCSAWAVAVALHDPDLDSTSRSIFKAARQTAIVSDPDFGLVAYALFGSADEAHAALCRVGR